MNYNIFKSRTVWTIIAMFVIGGLSSIEKMLPGGAQTFIEAVLGIAALYFHVNPSQQYNQPTV